MRELITCFSSMIEGANPSLTSFAYRIEARYTKGDKD
jgi:hypothetical protein